MTHNLAALDDLTKQWRRLDTKSHHGPMRARAVAAGEAELVLWRVAELPVRSVGPIIAKLRFAIEAGLDPPPHECRRLIQESVAVRAETQAVIDKTRSLVEQLRAKPPADGDGVR